MISPGLLTASTSKADHFGMSVVWVVCFCSCIFFAPFRSVFWSLRRCFPLAVKRSKRLGAHSHHPQARNGVEHSEQSGELCEWAVVKNRSEEGETSGEESRLEW